MSDIDEIKSRINVTDIIGEKITLKKAGRNFKALCPFHNEKTPSFIVSPDRQSFHCFGCGKGGSIIDFVMFYDNVDFIEALEGLAARAGVKLERRMADTPQARLKNRIYEVNHLAGEFYNYILTSHPLGEKARDYLKSRGVKDKTIKTFGLGYSPQSWDSLGKFLRKKGYDTPFLEQAGLVIKSARGGYDRFRGRLVFTLRDHHGNTIGFSGRLLELPADGRQEAKYINTSETPVYVKSNVLYGLDVTKSAIQKAGEAIIVEGEFDVISSFQEGISNIVAIKGSALTENHVNLLRRFTPKIVFALDSDLAGDAAARRGIDIADKAGLDIKVVTMPSGKDPDEAVRENPAAFKKAVKEAVPIIDYFMASAARRYEINTAYGKKNYAEELFPILKNIENPVVAAHYVKKVAQVLDIPEEAVTEGMQKIRKPLTAVNRVAGLKTQVYTKSRPEKLEIYTLAIILQTKTRDFFEELRELVNFEDITSPGVRQILELLAVNLQSQVNFTVGDFANTLPKELVPLFDEAYLWDLSDFAEDPELVERNWLKATKELRKSLLRNKIKVLTAKMSQEDEAGSGSEADNTDLHEELSKLTNQLRALEKIS